MRRETIQDSNYNTLGYIYPYDNGQLRATDAQFKTLGYYDPQIDITKDAGFQTLAHGNVLSALIYEQAQRAVSEAEPRGGATKPASCSGILATIFIVVGGAIYNWWGELTHRDPGSSSVTAGEVRTGGDQQQRSVVREDVSADADSANPPVNSPAGIRPQKEELRAAILHALDAGTPVQWAAGGKSGWINVSALVSTTAGTCRTVSATDDQQRQVDVPQTWCRRNSSDWEAQ